MKSFQMGPKARLLVLAAVAGIVALGCGQGTYPLDIFYEMHYQQSYKSGEPPRLLGVEDAVPVQWVPAPKSTSFNTGQYLYTVNCAMCHGQDAKGNGPVLDKIVKTYGYQTVVTPDLTTLVPQAIEPFLAFTFRPFGPDSVMPPFGKLLTAEEQLAIAQYVGTLPK